MNECSPDCSRDLRFDLLKVLACIAITNSHVIYPDSMFFLSIGGGHGNSLFFIISGYLLGDIKAAFPKWILRRWRRVFVPVIGVMIPFFLLQDGFIAGVSLIDVLNNYWFVFAIALYYPFYYFCMRNKNSVLHYFFLLGWLSIYILFYSLVIDKKSFSVELGGFSWFKVLFYFGIFLTGGIIRFYKSDGMKEGWRNTCFEILVILTSLLGWAFEYFHIKMLHNGFEFQFVIHLCIYIFAVAMLTLSLGPFGKCLKLKLMKYPKMASAIVCISDATLEIYLIQVTFRSAIHRLPFPASMLLFWIAAVGGGLLYHRIIMKCEERLP